MAKAMLPETRDATMISRWCRRLSIAVLTLCLVSEAHGADIAIAPDASSYAVPALSSVYRTIRLKGPIEIGDAAKLSDLMYGPFASKTAPKSALVVAELNSESGDYAEAMKLGEVLRDFQVTTLVCKGDQCLSGYRDLALPFVLERRVRKSQGS